jgi:hypothetical protein
VFPDLNGAPLGDDGSTGQLVADQGSIAMRQILCLAMAIGLTSLSFMALAILPVFA